MRTDQLIRGKKWLWEKKEGKKKLKSGRGRERVKV
jgi:hypothetical protein